MHNHILAAVLHLAGVPNPGTGTVPGGTCIPNQPCLKDELNTILSWIAWIATAACVVGILTVGGTMAMQHQRGRASEHMAGLMWVLLGCILIGTASSLVGLFA